MGSWIAWLIVAALLGVAEVMTATLAFGLLAVAAVVAAIVGGVGLGLPFQLAAFAVAAGAGLGVVRPLAVRHIRQPPLLRTRTSALIGRPALVIEEVTAHGGRVRIGGEVWSARWPGRRAPRTGPAGWPTGDSSAGEPDGPLVRDNVPCR
jgi:membrane protein implicated in regulation of membrane protease activity